MVQSGPCLRCQSAGVRPAKISSRQRQRSSRFARRASRSVVLVGLAVVVVIVSSSLVDGRSGRGRLRRRDGAELLQEAEIVLLDAQLGDLALGVEAVPTK